MVTKSALTLAARFSQGHVAQNEAARAVVMVSLAAPSEPSEASASNGTSLGAGDVVMEDAVGGAGRRKGINVVIVLDRSASMGDNNKLELCKKTITFLCEDLLAEVDRVGLVLFDSSSEVLYPCDFMTRRNKRELISRLNNVRPGDHTNLSGGIFHGLDSLRALGRETSEHVSAVLLLSDGQATSGVTDNAKLVRIIKNVSASIGELPPVIHTFGYGPDFDPVLQTIADETGGTFYHVQDVEHVPLAFADCLGGLLTVAAQNLTVDLILEGGGAQFGTSSLTTCPMELKSSTHCCLRLRDIYLGERRDILIEVFMPPLEGTNSMVSCTAQARFMDMITEDYESLESAAHLERIPDAILINQRSDENIEVARQVLRVEAANTIRTATIEAREGNIEKSQAVVENGLASIRERMESLNLGDEDDEMLDQILEDLETTRATLKTTPNPQAFVRSGDAAFMGEIFSSHANQRSNFSSKLARRAAYQTDGKKRAISKSKSYFSGGS